MRSCSVFLAAVVLWCAGGAAAPAAPVRLDEHAGAFALASGRVVWSTDDGLMTRSLGRTRRLTREPGAEVASVSSTLAAWTTVDAVGGHLPTVRSFREAVALPSGRVVDLVRCGTRTARCGCVSQTSFTDLLDPESTMAVDGDRVAVGRTGCARGVTIYERHGNRLRVRAVRSRASTWFGFRGRYLVWDTRRHFAIRSIVLYDWVSDRVVQRFRDVPFADGAVGETLGPGGQILVRAEGASGIGGVTVLLRPDGSRMRLRGLADGIFTGRHTLEQVTQPPENDAGDLLGAWRRVAVDLRTGRRSRLPIARPDPTAAAFTSDGRCRAWRTSAGALWIDSIDGRPSRAPACLTSAG